MTTNRNSFEEYLAKHKKVTGKSENTSRFGNLRETAAINYFFDTKDDAEAFVNQYHIMAHASRKRFEGEQVIFKDPVQNKWAVLILPDKHREIFNEYKEDLIAHHQHRSVDEIKTQIQMIEGRKQLLMNNPALANRLNTLNDLADNRLETGWHSPFATSTFHLSLQNYIALSLDGLSPQEFNQLNTVSEYIMGNDGDINKGRIKPDSNWWDFILSASNHYKNPIDSVFPFALIYADALHLLDGVENRRTIDVNTSLKAYNLPMVVSQDEKKAGVKTRDIPRFFPDNKNQSDTDFILINIGTWMHRIIIKIWKQGVTAEGKKVTTDEKAHHYEFYQTEYNAGAGLEWAEPPYYNKETDGYTTGVAWVISTKQIHPNWQFTPVPGRVVPPDPITNLLEYNRVMRDTITDLIMSQRMISRFRPAQPNNVAKDNTRYSEDNSDEARRCKELRDGINTHLGTRIDTLSKRGVPQTSGNCTVMSLKVMLDDAIPNLSEEHWRYAKGHNRETTLQEFDEKLRELEAELKSTMDYIAAKTERDAKIAKAEKNTARILSNLNSKIDTAEKLAEHKNYDDANQLYQEILTTLNQFSGQDRIRLMLNAVNAGIEKLKDKLKIEVVMIYPDAAEKLYKAVEGRGRLDEIRHLSNEGDPPLKFKKTLEILGIKTENINIGVNAFIVAMTPRNEQLLDEIINPAMSFKHTR